MVKWRHANEKNQGWRSNRLYRSSHRSHPAGIA
eukprot:UN10119